MSILNFVKAIAGSVEKRDLLSDIDGLQKMLEDNTIPVYKQASDVSLDFPQNNYLTKQLESTYKLHHRNGKGIITDVTLALSQLSLIIPWMRKEIDSEFGQIQASESLTFKKANLMQYIESTRFFLRYARSMLLIVVAINDNGDNSKYDPAQHYTMAEIKFLRETMNYFMYLIGVFKEPIVVTKKIMDAIPNVVINDESFDAMKQTLGQAATDPFKVGFVSPSWNPFYAFGRRRAEKQVKEFQEAKATELTIQLRIAALREKQNTGQADAAVEDQIGKYEDQIKRIRFDLDKMNDKFGIVKA